MDSSRLKPYRPWRRGMIALLALAACSGATLGLSVSARAAPTTTADFTVEPGYPAPHETVTFTSTSVPADGTTIVGHLWDLDGNGSFETDTGTSRTATRRYSSAGTVRVRLAVTDSAGGFDARAHRVYVTALQPPTASFTVLPSAPTVGEPVLFISTASDPDGTIVDQAWDLNGDGNFDNGSGRTALRSFAAPGSYVVGLRVTDNDGQVAFYSQTIVVAGVAGTTSKPGGPTLRLLSPFPLVRIAGQIMARGTRVRLLTVEAPAGSRISIRCRGRGCPFSKQVRAVTRPPRAHAARVVRVRRLERLLRPGLTIQIFVTRQDAIGKYTRFKMRRGKAPARADRCLRPGSSRPVGCPAV